VTSFRVKLPVSQSLVQRALGFPRAMIQLSADGIFNPFKIWITKNPGVRESESGVLCLSYSRF